MKNQRRWTSWSVLLAVALIGFGFGGGAGLPPSGEVFGSVTLDGEPLVAVDVVFKPAEVRAATGLTTTGGEYTLEYVTDVPGCKTGENTVSFDWATGAANAKLLQTKYTSNSEFSENVAAGSNTFDFALESSEKTKGKTTVVPD